MASRVLLIWLFFVAVLLSGCDSAEDLVNRRLPPVPAEQHRATAIQAAQAAIAGLSDANAAFNLRVEDIAAAVNASGVIERLGVGPLKLRADHQLILAEAEVAEKFSKDDFPELDANTKDRIEALRPVIKGKISLGLGLTSANADSKDGRLAISIHLLPLFQNMEVEYVALAGKFDVDFVVTLMKRLAEKLSSELGRAEIARVSFSAVPFKEADLSRAIAVRNADGAGEKVTITAKSISPPVRMRSVAWLAGGDNVTFIAELAPVGSPPVPAPGVSGVEDYAQLKAEFAKKLVQSLDIAKPPAANWIAVSKQLVAELVNAAFRQGEPCLRFEAALADRSFSNTIILPSNKAIDCTPEIDCTPVRDCSIARSCGQAEDCTPTRDCQVCALGACFNDPACERGKMVARQDCEIRKAARTIECERFGTPKTTACEAERAAKQASCETQKSAKKLACEAGKENLAKLAGAGNLAKISGTIGGLAGLSVCMKEVSVTASLERLKASAIVSGKGAIDLGMKYVPLEIAGYFHCGFSWAEDKRAKIEFPKQLARFDLPLVLETSTSNPVLRARIKTSALAARMQPSPRELLLQNYNLRSACAPVGAMLHDLTLDLTQSVPQIDDDFSLPGEERALALTLEPVAFLVSGTNLVDKAAYASNAKALILSGDQSAVPAN